MARPKTITSANAQLLLSLVPVFPVPVEIQGSRPTPRSCSTPVDAAETVMGVDGKMSAGWTPFITPMTISLQADSPSVKFSRIGSRRRRSRMSCISRTARSRCPACRSRSRSPRAPSRA
jgi:hypothetical protein